jgi:hypothetical protein
MTINDTSALSSRLFYINRPSYAVAASSDTTITLPTVSSGDVLVAFNSAYASPSATPPTAPTWTGWTNIYNVTNSTGTGARTYISYKICTGSESGTTLPLMSSNANKQSQVHLIRGNNQSGVQRALTGVTLSGGSSQVSSSTFTNQTLNLTTPLAPFVGFVWASDINGAAITIGSTVTATSSLNYIGGNARLFIASAVDGTSTYNSSQYVYEESATGANPFSTNSTISATPNGQSTLLNFYMKFT